MACLVHGGEETSALGGGGTCRYLEVRQALRCLLFPKRGVDAACCMQPRSVGTEREQEHS
jgi:hypothetical protein